MTEEAAEDVENLLESYFAQVSATYDKLRNVGEYIEVGAHTLFLCFSNPELERSSGRRGLHQHGFPVERKPATALPELPQDRRG